ncbi:MAG: leucyl aminopeptidase [Candidatus Puniceispirillaceae bacterium]
MSARISPARLSFEFSSAPIEAARLVLMHADTGFLHAASAEQESFIANACTAAEFTGKTGSFLPLHTHEGPVLVGGIGSGLIAGMAAENWGGKLFGQMKTAPFNQLQLEAAGFADDVLMSVMGGAYAASYHFIEYFTKQEKPPVAACLTITTDRKDALSDEWLSRKPLYDGVFTARDLVFEPANILYPVEFAKRCQALENTGLEIEVLNQAALEKIGMGALLGVGQGSERDSAVVVMKWMGGGDEAPIALVGKGVCFDTGGISLKPAKGMEDMKWDMGGAAGVTGAMHALAGRKVKRNVIGIIGLVENMPDGNAQRPGDVVTSLSGQTVEVINTDAEGRLVLADVLTYLQHTYKPQAIVDMATLTGAILVSLGKEHAGLFSNSDSLSEAVMQAGREVEETSWRMPMGKAYDDMLKSHIADMKNIGGPYGGSITAACFLERFIENDTPWVHLDIAGKAWSDKDRPTVPKGGTGFGVRLLNQLVDNWRDES